MSEQQNIQRPYKGMVTDLSLMDQPKETYRYALNAILEGSEGDKHFISNELSNIQCTQFPSGMRVVGAINITDDALCIFGRNLNNTTCYIGILDKYQNFQIFVETNVLNLSTHYPVKAIYRLRRNNQRVVYFVDGLNKPRFFNFDRLFDFYSIPYKTWLENPVGTFSEEKWEATAFELIRSYSLVPEFIKAEVLNGGGNVASGSYSAAIQLVNENLNPTEWISVSHPVRIYNDSLEIDYSQIRGSRNSHDDAQNFKESSKSIRWTFSNLDPNFSYYRIAVLQSNQGDGNVNRVLVSQLISIDNDTFTYTGNDTDMVDTSVEDIQVSPIDITSAKFITQMENRMILGGIKGKQVDFCSFQAKASKIKAYLVTTDVVAEDVKEIGNAKNPVSSFYMTGYMPGEVYSFGIVYTFKDGTKSPVYHIPGRPVGETPLEEQLLKLDTGMDSYQSSSDYPDIHKCLPYDYWGTDGYTGYENPLVNTPIRHHKFPDRTEALYSNKETQILTGYTNRIQIRINWLPTYKHPSNFEWSVIYKVNGVFKNAPLEVPIDAEQGDVIFIADETGSNIQIQKILPIPLSGHPTLTWTNQTISNYPVYKTITQKVVKTYGIKFTEIEKPHPDIIGFEIVRNKREDTDKIIVDNVILGPLVNNKEQEDTNDPYHAFGLLCPDLPNSAHYSDSGIYIFSPEHQFRNKTVNFDHIKINGRLTRSSKYLPIDRPDAPDGMYINDVQAGTTYNPEVHSSGDEDGFDLQVLYRSSFFNYEYVNNITIGDPLEVFYLSAAGNKQVGSRIFFNAGVDNKIIIARYEKLNTVDLFAGKLLYASLVKDNTTAYANFMNRVYYKEQNNITKFQGSTMSSDDIYNGDAYVAPMTINNSVYYDTKIADRGKKSKAWKIIVGSLLVVAAVAVSIFVPPAAVGLSALALSTLTSLAVAYGVSMLTSGIQFEVMKKMIDEHYEVGLKVCIEDNDNKNDNYSPNVDDRFCWFTDQIANIFFESSVNIGLRLGLTANVSDFFNNISRPLADYSGVGISSSADNFETYLMNKFTTIDRERSSGRLYLGYAVSELYNVNEDFHSKNLAKSFFCLPIEYECCSGEIETFHNRICYSEQSFQEEKIDNYGKFLPNNYRDIEGEYGQITNLLRYGDNLLIFTEESLFFLPQNLQERVTQELVTFIGTGDFFIAPKKTNGFGCTHDQSIIETPMGIFYISIKEKKVSIFGEGNTDIGGGISVWLKNNMSFFLSKYINDAFSAKYSHFKNTLPVNGIGFHAAYDNQYKRILLTKIDYLPRIEFTTFIPDDINLVGEYCYDTVNNIFGIVELNIDNDPVLIPIPFTDETIFENKSWTLSYSLVNQSWTSYHSYLPRVYMTTANFLYSAFDVMADNGNLFKHHVKGKYQTFSGINRKFIVELVSLSNPLAERIWQDIRLYLTAKKYLISQDDYITDKETFFTEAVFYNERQSSGLQQLFVRDSILQSDPKNYMMQNIKDNTNNIVVTQTEGVWSLNNLIDYVNSLSEPLFVKDWQSLMDVGEFPIDKIVNENVINYSKSWTEYERLRGKYLVMRFIFNNFANDNVQLTLNYSLETEQISLR